MKPVPFILVTGFLGSGKTTLLREALMRCPASLRIGLVQNEFAPANCDGVELRRTGRAFELMEINNGSAFCVCLIGSFVDRLAGFVRHRQPDIILMEASGLSDPVAVAGILGSEPLKSVLQLRQVWTVVDARHFNRLHRFMQVLRHQVQVADLVLINKTDLVESCVSEDLQRRIRDLNPLARVLATSHCAAVSEVLDQMAVNTGPPEAYAGVGRGAAASGQSPSGRPEVVAGVLRSSRAIGEPALMALLGQYGPATLRIKGRVRTPEGCMLSVQTCPEQIVVRKTDEPIGRTELIVLGEAFDLRVFSRDYKSLSEPVGV
jgi:G3E family GTPase